MELQSIAFCACGACTATDTEGKEYSTKDYQINTGLIDTDKIAVLNYSSCNYCVNGWGLDLCACGSGEHYKECKNELNECGKPYQELPPQIKALC